MKNIILNIILFLLCTQMYGQKRCGSEVNLTQLQQTDPARYQRIMDLENRIQATLNDPVKLRSTQQTPITIPVVVHIVYNNNTQNISDAQIQSQIEVLNEDYRSLNADKKNTPKAFESLSGDANIEFVLAKKDPNGKNTTGITRTFTSVNKFYQSNNDVKYFSRGGENIWNPQRYLNIWVCNLANSDDGKELLGYAQFPSEIYTSPQTDGVVINYKYFGRGGSAVSPYNKGRTTTHEVGHWLNLKHIWGDDGDSGCHCDGSDDVIDTPNQSVASKGCPSYPQTDCCTNFLPGIMFMNYMDYSDDACMNMFTNGQITRMRAVLYGERGEMLTYSHCNNGIQDDNETGVDCGGSCPACDKIPETCNDGIKNQNETTIDCGGVCPPCGIGGSLDDLATTAECECGDVGTLPVNNLNSLFSGRNIFDANNIKLSHGSYRNILSYNKYGGNFYRCRNIAYNKERTSNLNGGIFFEEKNVQFSPDKVYRLSFNYWMNTGFSFPNDRRGPVHLRLANGLTNTATRAKILNEDNLYKDEIDGWYSSILTIPKIKETFYIGYVKNISSYTNCRYYDDDIDHRYMEVSIIFRPDNYYSQLWVTTENNYPMINSFKIQEMCMENFVFNRNTQHIDNLTRASNMIAFYDIDYAPTATVEFIAGNTITLNDNIRIAPQNQGWVRMRIDANACPVNTLRSSEMVESNSIEAQLIDKSGPAQFDEIKLYPNPTTGIIQIRKQEELEIYNLEIYNMAGKLVRSKTETINPYATDISNLVDGIYILKIYSNKGTSNHRIVLKK